MNWKNSILFLLVCLASCKNRSEKEVVVSEEKEQTEFSYLIEVDELAKLQDRDSIKIIDFRKPTIYTEEHISGSLNIWRPEIEDNTYGYNGMMPSRLQLEALFSSLGIKNSDTVVIYDDKGMCDAARLWWILQHYNFKQVRLLNGGLKSWKEIGGDVTSEIVKLQQSNFKLSDISSSKVYATKEDVYEAITSRSLILDTRTKDEYSGKRQKTGAFDGGRIPGGIRIDWSEAVNLTGDQKLKSIAQLEHIYAKMNVTKDDPIIVYCHSGVRSAHTTFVLTEILGYNNVRNYDGSWIEWSYYEHLPTERDSLTTLLK